MTPGPGIVVQLVPGVPSEQMRIFYPADGWDEVMDLDEPPLLHGGKRGRELALSHAQTGVA